VRATRCVTRCCFWRASCITTLRLALWLFKLLFRKHYSPAAGRTWTTASPPPRRASRIIRACGKSRYQNACWARVYGYQPWCFYK
jgi:hypothetical protein